MNIRQLREWAGITVFERAERIAKYGQVYHCRNHNGHITAQVQGESLYEVSITANDHAECTCPAATYQPICKHAVATLLVHLGHYNEAQAILVNNDLALPDEDDVHHWLASLEKEALLTILHTQLQDNPILFEALQYRCYVETQKAPLTAEQVAALIDDALPYDNAWGYDEADSYFKALNDKYHALDQALAALPDEVCYSVAWHGIQRLNTVCIEYVNSTYGDYYTILELFSQHLFSALNDSNTALTDKLAFIIQAIEVDIDISESFLENLTDKAPLLTIKLGQALNYEALFETIPPSTAYEMCRHYSKLAATKELWQEAIEWLLKTELHWHDWLRMGSCHLKLAQYPQAEHSLIQAAKAQQNPEHHLLIDFACELASAQGQDEKAWQIRWNQFEKRPQQATLIQVQALMASEETLKEKQQSDVIELLLQRIKTSARPDHYIELLVSTALNYHRTDVLLTWAHHKAIGAHLGVNVAKALTPEHYDVASRLYHAAIIRKVEETNNGAYLEAVKLLAQYKQAANNNKEQHDLNWRNFVQQLRENMKRKRNFIRYLNERFTDK
ncbi:SWIM zinc finger family protein [Vibrio breoganii]|uniref:SWIM zinc finger family protein n=1 Tax=Vibrio breoganii TaxID=553239 RepID=UPI000C81FA6F|nr:SWIM zinc finger family protein [Vibrio breoganii]PML40439.1 hypothetical protein BCT77_07160 [Vibrio breoganii]PMO77647.1 hypothetical protein BCT02_07455 [Vibrio breoganii]PMO86559.1 hypothetical protein BCS99_11460 [Vibrio breoganii]